MDGMAVISRGLSSGRKASAEPEYFQELGIAVAVDESAIAVAVENEINIAVEVE